MNTTPRLGSQGFDKNAQPVVGERDSLPINDEARWMTLAARSNAVRQQSAGEFDHISGV
jgi:hypothetical protein